MNTDILGCTKAWSQAAAAEARAAAAAKDAAELSAEAQRSIEAQTTAACADKDAALLALKVRAIACLLVTTTAPSLLVTTQLCGRRSCVPPRGY